MRDVDRLQQATADGATRLFSVTTVVTVVAASPAGLERLWKDVTGALDRRALPWRPLVWREAEGFAQTTLGGRRRSGSR